MYNNIEKTPEILYICVNKLIYMGYIIIIIIKIVTILDEMQIKYRTKVVHKV